MKKTFFAVLWTMLAYSGNAQWIPNPLVNNIVRNSAEFEFLAAMVSDGSGGAICIISSDSGLLSAQHITPDGYLDWGPSTTGKIITQEKVNTLEDVTAVPDGTGGVLIGWIVINAVTYYADLYMQRLSATGDRLWGTAGVKINAATQGYNSDLVICADGSGGAYAGYTWDNWVNNRQAMLQHISPAGTALWPAGGLQLCLSPGFRAIMALVANGSGGAIALFADTRNDPKGLDYDSLMAAEDVNADIYAQRMTTDGGRVWTSAGVPVCTAPNFQYGFQTAVADGNGGVVAFWEDYRYDVPQQGSSTNSDIYAQHLDGTGEAQWAINGVAVCNKPGIQALYSAHALSADRFAAAWQEADGNNDYTMFAQSVLASGSIQWPPNGVAISRTGLTGYREGQLTGDSEGNLLYAYMVVSPAFEATIWAQKVAPAGNLAWGPNGASICANTAGYRSEPFMVPSQQGAAIIAWDDSRNMGITNMDVYASKVMPNGTLASGVSYTTTGAGAWNNPATWAGGTIPDAESAVIVRHVVTVTADATCKSLKVEAPGGRVEVAPGIKLNVLQ